ncbi:MULTISPECIES: DMT family transporter [unclassified Brevibacterium]|uniref:DMT family transporter n=1 Tax=unclassified Brevibacterium TaxID=2614124 RepID=UPI001091CAB7|nr:SMR family transporter [Brevibacterium sp. S22]TGD30969.1 QacE family quaternary ammonium compound efflux SMR transporter [Brevibacterium sp. S22]
MKSKRLLLLVTAILAEVAATLMLRASVSDPVWIPGVVVLYAAAFFILGLTQRLGMPLGTVYATWSASGVALVAMLGVVFFGEFLGIGAIIGIALIIIGVILVESGASGKSEAVDAEVAE